MHEVVSTENVCFDFSKVELLGVVGLFPWLYVEEAINVTRGTLRHSIPRLAKHMRIS
jgi:hypothetical protein